MMSDMYIFVQCRLDKDGIRLYNTGSEFGAFIQLMNGLLAELNQSFF